MKKLIPFLVLALGLAYLGSTLRPVRDESAFRLDDFGRLPVLKNGRFKPLDTVARNTLLQTQGRQTVRTADGRRLQPVEWLATLAFTPAEADQLQTFEIVHPEVLALLHLKEEDGARKKRFSFAQIRPQAPELERQVQLAEPVPAQARTPFQRAVLQLYGNLTTYQQLKYSLNDPESEDFLGDLTSFEQSLAAGLADIRANPSGQPAGDAGKLVMDRARHFQFMADFGTLLAVPAPAGAENSLAWKKVGDALFDTFKAGSIDPGVLVWAGLGHAWRHHQPEEFNTLVGLHHQQLASRYADQLRKSDLETRFNAAAPFYSSMTLFVLAFILAVASWLRWPEELGRGALYLLTLAFVATTAGIAARMWLEGRPPVTNLYSSAVFIGWAATGLCLALEYFYRNAIGSAVAGLIGFCTLLIAHHLSLSGDTLEMMRAVLDSNFWLATHVVIVTLGYSATYVAGFLAILYVVLGCFTRLINESTAKALAGMIYGIICFATLFSMVGTILGGIWADQSWGRFWGWDPKENGALMIVLWNALILHCRWGGLVKQRGLVNLAIGGNIITSWSWFGTNMLGVGLHSYGFMDAAFWWLIAFVASQLALIALSLLPRWRSFPDQGKV